MNARMLRYLNYTLALTAVMMPLYILRLFFPWLAEIGLGRLNLAAFVTGVVAGLCMLTAVWQINLAAGIFLGCLSAVCAYFTGEHPSLVILGFVAAGNVLFCLAAWIPSLTRVVSAVLAALLRCGVSAALLYFLADYIGAEPSQWELMWMPLACGLLGGLSALALTPHLPRARR